VEGGGWRKNKSEPYPEVVDKRGRRRMNFPNQKTVGDEAFNVGYELEKPSGQGKNIQKEGGGNEKSTWETVELV